jgi:ankyrin repeat protein
LAAKFSNISILKQLDLVINISQYIQKSTGNTMLHIAAIQGNVENLKFFILSGLDPLKKNNQNKNAFDYVPKHQLRSFLQ